MSRTGLRVVDAVAVATGWFAIAFAAVAACASASLLRRLDRRVPTYSNAPISIIKPLKGAAGPLYENLATFCRQDHPRFQLLFCLESPDDPAMAVVSRLRRDFPSVDTEVVVSRTRIGSNPKVSNMANAYPFAKHDLILTSDADTAVPVDFLRRMAAPFADPNVGITTAFYQATGATGLWGHLEALSVNVRFLPEAMTAAYFGMKFAMGAAIMMRRAAFEAAGGFAALADDLADDFRVGELIQSAGWTLEHSPVMVDTIPDIETGADHFNHLSRWARTIRLCNPVGYAASVVQHGFTFLLLRVLLLGPSVGIIELLAGVWFAKSASSMMLASLAGWRQPLSGLALIPLAELFGSAAWAVGWRSAPIHWRGHRLSLRPQGRLLSIAVPPRAGVLLGP